MNSDNVKEMIIGAIAAMMNGVSFPLVAMIMAEMIEVLSNPGAEDFRERSDFLCLMFVVIAVVMLFT